MFVQGDVCVYHGPKTELNGATVVVDCVIPETGAVVANNTNGAGATTGWILNPKNLRLKPPSNHDEMLSNS